jgi:hypothetical protein
MTAIAVCRSLSEIFVSAKMLGMVQGVADRRGQDKSRKVRPVGRLGIACNGAERYDRFVEALGRRLSSGSTVLREVSIESHDTGSLARTRDEVGST